MEKKATGDSKLNNSTDGPQMALLLQLYLLTSMFAVCYIFISHSKRKDLSCTKQPQPLVNILSDLQ